MIAERLFRVKHLQTIKAERVSDEQHLLKDLSFLVLRLLLSAVKAFPACRSKRSRPQQRSDGAWTERPHRLALDLKLTGKGSFSERAACH